MEYLLGAKEMKTCDENTSRELGISEEVLMERAALAVAEETMRRIDPRDKVLVLCGTGNNGGDGLAAARILSERHIGVSFYMTGVPKKGSLSEKQLAICRKCGVSETTSLPEREPDAVIDAIFGTGLSREIEGDLLTLLETVNQWNSYRIAVDIPSGVSSDTGKILKAAFCADLTVTFAFRKLGHILFPGASCCGEVLCAEIGITEKSFLGMKPKVRALTREDLSTLPPRRKDSHKGDYGKLLVIAGSPGMCGASLFAAKAAYRTGAGLIRIFAPEENRIILQETLPEAVLTLYRGERFDEKELLEAIHWADAVLIGPGLGSTAVSERILKCTLSAVSVPLVMDADALNLLAKEPELLKRPHTDIVITPHLKEMSRLTGDAPVYLKEEKLSRAAEFANEYNVIVTLKDSRTVTAIPYGNVYLNTSGNNGMATAGTGDVLAGIMVGLIGTGLSAEQAAPLAVYLHGLAGEDAAERKGARSMMASDLIDSLCTVLRND